MADAVNRILSKGPTLNRRTAIAMGAIASLAATRCSYATSLLSNRKFTMDLCPGRIGVQAGQEKSIELAAKYGFESVEPQGEYLAKLGDAAAELGTQLTARGLRWGAAGLSVEFRKDAATFEAGLKALPAIAKGLAQAGVTRIGTWLMPKHDELTYLANFKQHVSRLREIAKVLADHHLRFGLEYVGPRTMWSAARYPFVHSMAETKELIAEIGLSNVGFVLDSWHWYTAEEGVEDLLSLKNDDVVAVDLNDAPSGIDVREQIDSKRELPAATGIIDVKSFLSALVSIQYDGPVRAEPFNAPLNALDDGPAVEKTAAAIRAAFSQIA